MTDVKVLHGHGLSHHQTGPLRIAGYGFGGRRVALVCDAVDSWRIGAES